MPAKKEQKKMPCKKKSIDYAYTVEKIPIERLFIDESYQREVMLSHVCNIASDLDGALFHPLATSERAEGDSAAGCHAVIDGQHRYLAALKENITGEVWCLVYRGLTYYEEAGLFQAFQDKRKNLSPYDSYKAGLAEQNPECIMVEQITRKHGFKVASKSSSDGTIGAVAALRKICSTKQKRAELPHGADLLDRTLALTTAAWGNRSPEGHMLHAIARFLAFHEPGSFDKTKLVERLAREGHGGVQHVARKLGGSSMNGGRGREMAIYRAIIHVYNRGERTSRIAPYYA